MRGRGWSGDSRSGVGALAGGLKCVSVRTLVLGGMRFLPLSTNGGVEHWDERENGHDLLMSVSGLLNFTVKINRPAESIGGIT